MTEKSSSGQAAAPPPPNGWKMLRHPILWAISVDPHPVTAWGTVGLALVTCVLAGLAYCSLLSSETSTRRSERAFVFAAPSGAFNVKSDSPALQGYVVIMNNGKTFAKITDWQIGINLLEAYSPERLEGLGQLRREAGKPVIWPGFPHIAFRTLRVLSGLENQMLRTDGGDRRIYVFGIIKYEDVFGERHQTTFCHMYFGPEMGDNSLNTYSASQVKYCDNFNDAN